MYKSFDVARSKPEVNPTSAGGFTPPKALMFHAIYRNPGGEEQSFANESKLLKSIGYETVQCTTENSKISRGPWAAVTAVFSPRVLVDALRIIRSERPRRHLREQSLAGVLGFVARGLKSRRNSYVAGGSELSPRHTVSQVARRWHVHRMRFHQILHELCPQRMLRKQPTAEPCLLPERYGGQAERLWVEAAQVRRNERDDSTSGRRTTDQFWPRRGSSELRIRRK